MDIGIIEALKHNSSKNMISKKQYEQTVKSLKGQLSKKDKVINSLAYELHINNIFDCDYKHFKDNKCKIKYPNVPNKEDCKKCIINYFTKKVEKNETIN